jgi:threonine/homoserine/homoserine lactone efflux protein
MLMCLTNALNHGPRKRHDSGGWKPSRAVLGVMLLSAMGLGALLAASEAAFTDGQTGGAPRIWCGWASRPSAVDTPLCTLTVQKKRRHSPGVRSTCRGLLVGASNPKAVLFFAAFFPQFLEPGGPHVPRSSPFWP